MEALHQFAPEILALLCAALLLWRLRIVRLLVRLVLRPVMMLWSMALLGPLIFVAFLVVSAQS